MGAAVATANMRSLLCDGRSRGGITRGASYSLRIHSFAWPLCLTIQLCEAVREPGSWNKIFLIMRAYTGTKKQSVEMAGQTLLRGLLRILIPSHPQRILNTVFPT